MRDELEVALRSLPLPPVLSSSSFILHPSSFILCRAPPPGVHCRIGATGSIPRRRANSPAKCPRARRTTLMSVTWDPECQAAIALAKQCLEEGAALDVGSLLGALYHSSSL